MTDVKERHPSLHGIYVVAGQLVSMAVDCRTWHADKSFLMHDVVKLMLS